MGNQQYILNLDGNGKAINRIVVYGKDAGNWGYTPSAFDVTAL